MARHDLPQRRRSNWQGEPVKVSQRLSDSASFQIWFCLSPNPDAVTIYFAPAS